MPVKKRTTSGAALLALAATQSIGLASAGVGSLMFNAISTVFPQDQWVSTQSATVNGAVQSLNYNPLFRAGYTDNGNTLGQLLDNTGKVIYTINDYSSSSKYTTSYVNVSCTPGVTGSWTCPTGFTSFWQNTNNNAVAPAGSTFSTCGTSYLPGCATATATTIPDISNAPDYTSLLSKNGKLYTIVQFETPQPGAMYLSQVKVGANGVLAPVPGTLVPVDFSAYGGLLNPCAGSTTPWQSHLGSEESYLQNARDFEATYFGASTSVGGSNTYTTVGYNSLTANSASVAYYQFQQALMMRYFGKYPSATAASDITTNLDPYMYGYITEVSVSAAGAPVATKHMALGRAAWEMAYVMPDQKTVYGSVDAENSGWYKFVANTAGDLSAGTLSCAVFNQTSAVGSSAASSTFTISWTSMGATSDAAAMGYVGGANGNAATQLTFSDIFSVDVPTSATSGACNAGFTSVNTAYSYTVGGVTYYNECLKLNPGMAAQAAMFETARYAGMLGCTQEFTKWEGITFSVARNQLYASLSYWTKGGAMSTTLTQTVSTPNSTNVASSPSITVGATLGTTTTIVGNLSTTVTVANLPNPADIGGSQDISMASAGCGCVMYINVDSTYSATSMGALVCGVTQSADSNGNTCIAGSLSSPDNVAFIEDFDTLIIGEDTSTRRTDFVWEYTFPTATGSASSPAGGVLTPIFTTNFGAETTSPYWNKVGNNGYLSLVVQHPYGESDNAFANTATSTGVSAWIGFIGPINLAPAAAPAPYSAAPVAARAAAAALAAAALALLL